MGAAVEGDGLSLILLLFLSCLFSNVYQYTLLTYKKKRDFTRFCENKLHSSLKSEIIMNLAITCIFTLGDL